MFSRVKLLVSLAALATLLNGCATGLNYNQVSPNASKFHPKVSLLLPVKLPEGYDLEQEQIGNTLTDALTSTKVYGQVIDPATARNQLAAKENKGLSDAVTNYISKLTVTGVSDAELSKIIGQKYHSDTIIVAEMSRYGYGVTGGQKYGEVGFSIKVIDADTGSIYWKAGHTAQETYSLFKPNLSEMARTLMKQVLSFSPNPQ